MFRPELNLQEKAGLHRSVLSEHNYPPHKSMPGFAVEMMSLDDHRAPGALRLVGQTDPDPSTIILAVFPNDSDCLRGVKDVCAAVSINRNAGQGTEYAPAWNLEGVYARPPKKQGAVKSLDALMGAGFELNRTLLLAAEKGEVRYCTARCDEALYGILKGWEFPMRPIFRSEAVNNGGMPRQPRSVWFDIEELRQRISSQTVMNSNSFLGRFASVMRQQRSQGREVPKGVEPVVAIGILATAQGGDGNGPELLDVWGTKWEAIPRDLSTVPEVRPSTAQRPSILYEHTSEEERERLEEMAKERADGVSVTALGDSVAIPGFTLVDVGAGSSTSLAELIKSLNESLRYLPVDTDKGAIKIHQEAGWEAIEESALDIPWATGTAHAVHSRFLHGWLSPEARLMALQEMLRVGRHDTPDRPAQLAILDYDWEVAKGPEPVQLLINEIRTVIDGFTFNPAYGAEMVENIKANLKACGLSQASYEMMVGRDQDIRPLAPTQPHQALSIIKSHVDALLTVVNDDVANKLKGLYRGVESYAYEHPDETVTFPDIVNVAVKLIDTEAHAATVNNLVAMRRKQKYEHSLREGLIPKVTPEFLDTRILPPDLILEGQKAHATIYRGNKKRAAKNVTEEAIVNGVLIPEIDSPEVVAASTYIVRFDSTGQIKSMIRNVEHGDNPVTLLPTVKKLEQLLKEDGKSLKDLPVPADFFDKPLYEGSAFGSVFDDDPAGSTKILLSSVAVGLQRGHKYAIVGFTERAAGLLPKTYGDQAFKRIGGESLVITLDGKGIPRGGVRLVPHYVELANFASNILGSKPEDKLLRPEAIPSIKEFEKYVRNFTG